MPRVNSRDSLIVALLAGATLLFAVSLVAPAMLIGGSEGDYLRGWALLALNVPAFWSSILSLARVGADILFGRFAGSDGNKVTQIFCFALGSLANVACLFLIAFLIAGKRRFARAAALLAVIGAAVAPFGVRRMLPVWAQPDGPDLTPTSGYYFWLGAVVFLSATAVIMQDETTRRRKTAD